MLPFAKDNLQNKTSPHPGIASTGKGVLSQNVQFLNKPLALRGTHGTRAH